MRGNLNKRIFREEYGRSGVPARRLTADRRVLRWKNLGRERGARQGYKVQFNRTCGAWTVAGNVPRAGTATTAALSLSTRKGVAPFGCRRRPAGTQARPGHYYKRGLHAGRGRPGRRAPGLPYRLANPRGPVSLGLLALEMLVLLLLSSFDDRSECIVVINGAISVYRERDHSAGGLHSASMEQCPHVCR